MSFLGRIFLLTMALLLASVIVLAVMSTLGWIPSMAFTFAGTNVAIDPLPLSWGTKALWWLISLPVLLAAAVLVLIALSPSGSTQIYLNRTKMGRMLGGDELSVAKRGMDALAVYESLKIKGVMQADSNVRLRRKGWLVDLQLGLVPGTAIPEVIPSVHEAIGESLLHHTGVPVDKLRIRVQFGSSGTKKRVS